jgi:putative membrane-bound dehydrogenase-like protein
LTGWADWEKGEDLLKRITVPPAPVLTAEEELATFKVAPGYRVELVASEPFVQNPIFFEFDPDGRIWVVEYQGYMRDIDGSGEDEPICRVVVLEDTDADGKADRHTVFLDQLVMPRSFAFVKGGILLQEPPTLWFCEDTDGDLRADSQTEVGTMGVAGNPQHTANGLRYAIDNWLHCADWTKRYRWREGALIEEETIQRGQFGVTFDETGRFMTCYENKALYGDWLPADYLSRNPHLLRTYRRGGGERNGFGVNVDFAPNAQEVFPIRVTPAVTLGALELRDDGRLETYTIAAGTTYYDGHQFPDDARRNVFVPESGGHLIGRIQLSEGIAPDASRVYPPEQEFLASTDERFRPVNGRVGPDGALYIADMYHGIIEHVIFMVPWLEKQIEERKLGEGNDLGRIWRIVAEDRPIDRVSPKLSEASTEKLVETLDHPNGWHRITAQRLLLEREDKKALPLLRKAAGDAPPLAALHALWTLSGFDALDTETRLAALKNADERVRAAAIRLSEGDESMLSALLALAGDESQSVRLQLALSLSTFPDPDAEATLATLIEREAHPLFRTAALTGLSGRELEFLHAWIGRGTSDESFVSLLAQCVLEEGSPSRVAEVVALLANTPEDRPWQRAALLDAFARIRYPEPFELKEEPVALTALLRAPDVETREKVMSALNQFTWPGMKAPDTLTQNAAPLTPEQEQRVRVGQELYATACVACHQPHGGGVPGIAPPLAGSEWVSGPPERLARIVMNGLYGPIQVNGQTWNLSMPAHGTYTDEDVAAVLSYVRRAWGNTADPVEPALATQVRAESEGRTLPWRAEELAQVAGDANEIVAITPTENGEILLPASKATVFGQRLAYRPALDVLAPWVVAEDIAEWQVDVAEAGTYDVSVMLAADDKSAGDFYIIETEGSQTRGEVPNTGGYDKFVEQASGKLTLRAGANRVILRTDGPLKQELADVRGVRLVLGTDGIAIN